MTQSSPLPSWPATSIRGCLADEFPGAWGGDPRPSGANAYVLRSTNLDDDGHIDFASAVRRWIDEADVIRRRLRDGDVLLETSGGGPGKPVGRVAHFRAPDDSLVYLCSNFFRALRPDERKVHSQFLAWRLLDLHRQPRIWNYQQQTTGIINLKTNDYLEQCFGLPDKPEQFRIAAALDMVDDGIVKAEAVIAKLRRMRAGLVHDLLTFGLDNHGHLRDPIAHPDQFKESPLGKIPTEWDCGPAEKSCKRITVGVVNAATQAYVSDGVPFIRSQNVIPNAIDTSEMLFITEAFNLEHTNSILRSGDVAIVRTGYPGIAAVIPPALDGANCFSLIIATPAKGVLSSHFLAQYMNSALCRRQIDRLHFGSAQHNFNVGEMRRLPLRLPLPPEQEQITHAIARHDNVIATEIAMHRKLGLLKRGLMTDLLTGRERVPDDLTTKIHE